MKNGGHAQPFRKTRQAACGLLSACVLLSGCGGHLNDVREVSAELHRRTGHGLSESEPGEVVWPPGVSPANGLSEDELVTLALWNNAAFQEALADLGLSRADLVQARMLPNPTLWMLFPVGIKPLELLFRYPMEAFWLRSRRVESAALDVERIAQGLVQNGLDVIRDARLASTDLVLGEERLRLAGITAQLARDIADLSRARLSAGDATELEAMNAGVDARQAEEQHIRWRHEADIARERLRTLVGLGLEHWPSIIEAGPLPLAVAPDADHLVKEALAARPDLRAAEMGLEAVGERIGLAHWEMFTVMAILSTKDVNGQTVSGPGLDVALPLFNQNQGGIAKARANLEKAARFYNTVRDRIVLEVRTASSRLNQARESHGQWQNRILPPLTEAVQHAEKAYAAGNVSYLFVLETRRKWLDASLGAAVAAADLRRARAELERSIGRSLDRPSQISNVSPS